MKKNKTKMIHAGQIMILAGLLMSAIGGYIYYFYSNEDANKKHEEIIQKGDKTIDSIKKTKNVLLSNQKTNFKLVEDKFKNLEKLQKAPSPKTQITVNGNNNHVVGGDNTGINGDVYLDKPERKLDTETLNSIIALNKNKKPFNVIYYTNTEECRKFGLSIINSLKQKGYEVKFSARTAMGEINYPPDKETNALYEEDATTFILAIYPLR